MFWEYPWKTPSSQKQTISQLQPMREEKQKNVEMVSETETNPITVFCSISSSIPAAASSSSSSSLLLLQNIEA